MFDFRPRLALAGLALLLAPTVLGAGEPRKTSLPGHDYFQVPAAVVRGKAITLADLNSPEIYKARQQLFELEGVMLRERVLGELRDAMPKEFPKPLVIITPKEVEQVYHQAGLSGRGPLDNFRERIRGFLTRKKTDEFNQKQYQLAVEKGYVNSHHLPPPAFLVTLARVKRKTTRGPEGAPVHIVEFSDFQCPFCRRVLPTLAALEAKYGQRVHFVYRHLPLSEIHSEARAAAEASECAAEQGKFWPYHDLLFAHPQKMSTKELQGYAREAKVPDLGGFTTCLSERRFASRVDGDMEAAKSLGMGGTPSFFIGRVENHTNLRGEVLSGAVPLENFVTVVERFLKKPAK